MTNCCYDKDPRGHDMGSVMTVLLGNPIVRCVLLTIGCCLEIQSFMDLHAKEALAIGVEMFITLGRPSDAGKGNVNMFITLEILSDVGKGIVVLIKCNTTTEAVPIFLGPKNIPLKPPYKFMDSITVVHSIHF